MATVFQDQDCILDEFRPMLKCTLCQKDPTRIHDAPHESRKFYSMTSHVTYQHDMCVSQFKRIHIPAASWRKASRSSQMVDDECLRVDQTRENPSGGRPFTWSERKIIRAHGQSDTNGELAELPLKDQSKNADHIHAPRASAYSTNKNSHLLARDEYPEVVHAEKAAESGIALFHSPYRTRCYGGMGKKVDCQSTNKVLSDGPTLFTA